jgi:hypothetical protein
LHDLLAGETLSVNVTEKEKEDNDKEGCVNTAARKFDQMEEGVENP